MLSLFSRLLHRKARTGRMVIANQHDIANSRRKQNQLSPLTPERVKQLYELYRDGKYADPMLAWEALEEFDETLATVVDRRQSALGEMQWSIATDAQAIGDDSALAALAEEQQEYLAAHFRRVANLTEAVKWLGMASFRKFAHLEVVKQGRDILWLPINQWLLFRPLHEGKWYYNQDVQNSPARGEELDESRLIVREVARPIDLPCMYLIVSKMHAITQWDGFLDVFGIPSMFIEMPQGTNEELRQEFIEVVNSVIGEGRGVLPSGAAVKTVETTASGGDTFTSRADWCDKGIVRRGTGGQLTVLTEAGSGTLAGNAQQETFRMLAAADAADIASVINRQYTRRVLEQKFEGQPHLAYWTLDYANENEQKQKTDAIVQLAAAGWRAKDETVSEIVGFEVTTAQPQAGAMPGAEGGAAPGGLLPNTTPEEPDANIVTNRRMEADAAAGIYPGEFEEEDEEAVSDDAAPMTEDELAALKQALSGGLSNTSIATDSAALEQALTAALVINSDDECEAKDPLHCPYHGISSATNTHDVANGVRKTPAGANIQAALDDVKNTMQGKKHPTDNKRLNTISQNMSQMALTAFNNADNSAHPNYKLNLIDYTHTISPDALAHAQKRHPYLTDDDIMLISDIADKPDSVEFLWKGKGSKEPTLVSTKQYGKDTYMLVERIGTRHRTAEKNVLMFKTLYIKN